MATALAGRRMECGDRHGRGRPRTCRRLAGHALAAAPPQPAGILPKAKCCARSIARRRPSSSTRQPSRRIVTWWAHYTVSAAATFSAGSIEETIPLVEPSSPPQSSRSSNRGLVFRDWAGVSAAVAHRRGDQLARKSAQRPARSTRPLTATSPLPMPLKARPNPPPPNSPRPEGFRGGDLFSSIGRLEGLFRRMVTGWPKFRALWEATYPGQFRKAGMPEE